MEVKINLGLTNTQVEIGTNEEKKGNKQEYKREPVFSGARKAKQSSYYRNL